MSGRGKKGGERERGGQGIFRDEASEKYRSHNKIRKFLLWEGMQILF